MGVATQGEIAGKSEAFGNEMQAVEDGEQGRSQAEESGSGERPESGALHSSRYLTVIDEGRPGRFDQVAVGNSAGAGRLTPATLHTGVEGLHDLPRDRGASVLYFAHESDSATWGERLIARHAIGRAVGKTKATLDAGVEIVGVEVEVHVSFRELGPG